MIAAVAGTFNVLHDGHRRLLSRAFEVGDRVFIGMTSDHMASSGRKGYIPLYLRRKALVEFVSSFDKPFEIFTIDDVYGPREHMDRVDVLVVSEETEKNGITVSEERVSRGLPPLEIDVVPLVMADDGEKISASRIMSGMYGRSGNSKVMDIAVGSANHVKVEAVRCVMERIYGEVRVTGFEVDSGVPPQPFEGQTRQGAINRAKAVLEGHDLAVGIEAGVFEKEEGLYDYQYCAVLDSGGRLTVGTGSGFMYPPPVVDLVRKGMTVGDAMKAVFDEKDIGKGQGAIGFLSKGLLDRKGLTEQSVTAAMVPRLDGSYVGQ
ncbi:MAG: inosine/xanthosine triphosphatase [archaeon]|nr:inosine/xanthosine triphosphatase [archaeon]